MSFQDAAEKVPPSGRGRISSLRSPSVACDLIPYPLLLKEKGDACDAAPVRPSLSFRRGTEGEVEGHERPRSGAYARAGFRRGSFLLAAWAAGLTSGLAAVLAAFSFTGFGSSFGSFRLFFAGFATCRSST